LIERELASDVGIHCQKHEINSECHVVSELQRLMEIMSHLRSPEGCPWDQEQTHQSLTRCLIEEVSETLEAIDEDDMELLEEELGDLLLQVVFHAQIAKENGNFDIEDVARGISDKLVRRHPHVFGDEKGTIDQADQVVDRWEQVKAEEKKQKGISNENPSIFKKLPPRLPALLFANDIYKRAEKADLEDRLSLDKGKIDSMTQNLDQEKAGRALFELVAACRKSGLDPEACLRDFASKQMQEAEDTPA
jgi:XTP/dITP diphosphohydrolase/tetrapyrrole methylase family protein/MazG family protein